VRELGARSNPFSWQTNQVFCFFSIVSRAKKAFNPHQTKEENTRSIPECA